MNTASVYPGQPPAYPQQNQGAYPAQPPGYVAEQQPYPAQPYPAQPYPAQPYPAQPYPAQMQGYPQPAGYPATDFKQYPPDYVYPQPGVSQYPPTAQQQICTGASTNVVVVQPQPTVSMQPISYARTGDYFLTLSVVMTALCCVFGGWWNLLFTLPAVILAGSAKSDASHGRTTSAQQKSKIALGLNVLAVLLYIVGVALIVGLSSSNGVSLSSSYGYSGYSGYYGYSYYSYYYYCSYCNDYYSYCSYNYGYSSAYYYSYSYTYYDYYTYYCY